jgi:hypothetical protein
MQTILAIYLNLCQVSPHVTVSVTAMMAYSLGNFL